MMSGEDEEVPADAAAATAAAAAARDEMESLPRSMRHTYPSIMRQCFKDATVTSPSEGSVARVIVTSVEKLPGFFWAQIKVLYHSIHQECILNKSTWQKQVEGCTSVGSKIYKDKHVYICIL